jgi:hypothetical protein
VIVPAPRGLSRRVPEHWPPRISTALATAAYASVIFLSGLQDVPFIASMLELGLDAIVALRAHSMRRKANPDQPSEASDTNP